MVAIILGLLMGIAHHFSEYFSLKYKTKYKTFRDKVISFSAGVSLTYIFLDLFPNFSEAALQTNKLLFIFVLLGFVFFHVVEKYIYQHTPKNKLRRDLALEDSIISFIYHFIVGIVLVNFLKQGLYQGMLFFIPVLLYTSVSTLPVDPPKIKSVHFLLSLSTLFGIIFATYIFTNISLTVFYALLGTVIGALSFTIMRHSIPSGREGRPLFLIIGAVLYAALIIFNWSLGR